jgi:hypothetical protein
VCSWLHVSLLLCCHCGFQIANRSGCCIFQSHFPAHTSQSFLKLRFALFRLCQPSSLHHIKTKYPSQYLSSLHKLFLDHPQHRLSLHNRPFDAFPALPSSVYPLWFQNSCSAIENPQLIPYSRISTCHSVDSLQQFLQVHQHVFRGTRYPTINYVPGQPQSISAHHLSTASFSSTCVTSARPVHKCAIMLQSVRWFRIAGEHPLGPKPNAKH